MQKVLNSTLGIFLVIAMMALCMVPALAAKPMNTGKWYDDGMNEFIDKGYITGYGNGDYGPERNMTRAEFIAVVNKVMGYKDADMNAAAKFKDMDAGKWYYKPIAIALKEGFVKGNHLQSTVQMLGQVLGRMDGNVGFAFQQRQVQFAGKHVIGSLPL